MEDRSRQIIVIEAHRGWRPVDWAELWAYRDLFLFLVVRSVKIRYAQSIMGIGWAIVQPLFSMLVFTIVFGKMANLRSDGIPYPLWSFAGLVPWTYFANALGEGSSSLVSNARLISKVYFPRLILPISSVTAKLLDFGIAFLVLLVMMIAYSRLPTWNVVFLPLLILLLMVSAAGLGIWLTALAIQYRDVKYAMGFAIQLLMYAAPVVYPTSYVPAEYRLLYALNPMVGVIEGFRSALLGSVAMPWDLIGVGAASALAIALTGAFYFRRRERVFADVA